MVGHGVYIACTHRDEFGFDVDDPDTSPWELLMDWLEPYKSATYSVGVVGVRCADIEPRNKVMHHLT